MKIPITVACSSCGNEFPATGYGEERFPAAECPACGNSIHILDPLSISKLANRLLYRSKAEMDGGDYTLSIICSAIAVECTLTQLFLRWKGSASFSSTGLLPTEAQKDVWEQDYPKSGGFLVPADFVSKYVSGMKFDDFVNDFIAKNNIATLIRYGFPQMVSQMKAEYIQNELFKRRNRIMHWGKVGLTIEDAARCLNATRGAIGILTAMDGEKCKTMEQAWRASLG